MAGRIISKTHWQTPDGILLPYVPDHKGIPRVLGALRPRPNFGAFPRWKDVKPMVSRDQWEERDYSSFISPILDQGEHGSCVGHGSCTAFTRAWLMAGHDLIKFSSCYIYGKINGGVDQGAIVSDAMDQLIKGGVCLESTVPEGMVYAKQFPKGAAAEASKYRVADAYHVGSFDELMSALMYGYTLAHGIWVGDAYSNLDAGGVPPVGGDGGHCQESHGIVKVKAGRYKGQWAARTQNSWTESWGDGGCCNLVEAHFTYNQNAFGGLDAFAIRSTVDAPDDPTNPPIAVA